MGGDSKLLGEQEKKCLCGDCAKSSPCRELVKPVAFECESFESYKDAWMKQVETAERLEAEIAMFRENLVFYRCLTCDDSAMCDRDRQECSKVKKEPDEVSSRREQRKGRFACREDPDYGLFVAGNVNRMMMQIAQDGSGFTIYPGHNCRVVLTDEHGVHEHTHDRRRLQDDAEKKLHDSRGDVKKKKGEDDVWISEG